MPMEGIYRKLHGIFYEANEVQSLLRTVIPYVWLQFKAFILSIISALWAAGFPRLQIFTARVCSATRR